MQVIFHADDYGITPSQSRRILQCCNACSSNSSSNSIASNSSSNAASSGNATNSSILASTSPNAGKQSGLLNSLSMFANTPYFDECANLLENKLTQIEHSQASNLLHIGLHVNLVEGHCVADSQDIPMLVDENGMFCLGFTGLLKLSSSNSRDELQQQIETEIDAQLAKILDRFPQMRGALRVDSHQHTHAIPVVFDALLASIERSGCTLEYMRVPVESCAPFATPSVFRHIKPVNLAKRLLLGHLWKQNAKAHPAKPAGSEQPANSPHSSRSPQPTHPSARPTAAFCGVLFSGEMSASNVEATFERLVADASTRKLDLELLFHPGIVDSASECLNPQLQGFVDFSTSKNRNLEAQALKSFDLAYQNELPTLIHTSQTPN